MYKKDEVILSLTGNIGMNDAVYIGNVIIMHCRNRRKNTILSIAIILNIISD